MMKKKNAILGLLLTAGVMSCQDNAVQNNTEDQNKPLAFEKVLTASPERLKTQTFEINPLEDTTLVGAQGSQLTIYKNSFVDALGKTITGQVEIVFKECLSQLDMVLGNMVTVTTDGSTLESGGMFYLNASVQGAAVQLAPGKAIDVSVPTDEVLPGMALYEGVEDEEGLRWDHPVDLEELEVLDWGMPVVESGDAFAGWATKLDTVQKRHNVGYFVQEFVAEEKHYLMPEELQNKISEIIWSGDGMRISKDSSMLVDDYHVDLIKQDTFVCWDYTEVKRVEVANARVNTRRQDQTTAYVFQQSKLGWANIDRLLADERTQLVDLITEVSAYQEFSDVYVSLVFKAKNIYLPGYQKYDNTYGFSHGDFDHPRLPVGEEAMIVVTAYKQGQPYFAQKSFTIQQKTEVELIPEQTTEAEMKETLAAVL